MTKHSGISRLDDSLDLIFRSRNQQVMLSRLHEYRDFTALLRGEHAIQVITPDKKIFSALLEPMKDTHSQFLIVPQGERPPIRPEDSLLLLLQNQGTTAISQALVTSVVGSKFRVVAVDPRKNIRYKTRIAAAFRCISRDCLNKLLSKDCTVARASIKMDSLLDPMTGNVAIVRDFFTNDGAAPCTDSEVFTSGKSSRALIVDVSNRGFAALTSEKIDVDAIRANMFISVDFRLPHVTNDFSVTVVAAVRHVRHWKNGICSFHCMFVEEMPSAYIVI